MNKFCWLSPLSLALILATSLPLSAQRADTLRRSLTVLTSEQIELSPRQPLETPLALPPLPKAKLIELPLGTLPEVNTYPLVSPLSSIPKLPKLWHKPLSLGYAELSLGLKYNGRASLGLRPINREDERLNLYALGHYSNFASPEEGPSKQIKELGIGIAGQYARYLGTRHRLELNARYRHNRTPYYGAYIVSQVGSQTTPLSIQAVEDLALHRMELGGSFASEPNKQSPWSYQLATQLRYTRGKGYDYYYSSLSASEQSIRMAGEASYRYNQHSGIGAHLALHTSNYTTSQSINPNNHRNKSVIRLAPYWTFSSRETGHSFALKAGVSIDFLTYETQGKAQLRPLLEGSYSFSAWRLGLRLGGDVKLNEFADMFEELPHLLMRQEAPPTRRSLYGELTLAGKITPNFGLNVALRHEQLRQALNYLPTLIPPRNSTIATPSYYFGYSAVPTERGSNTKLSAGFDYLHQGQWKLETSAQINVLSSSLLARPTFILDGAWRWVANESWQVGLGYRLEAGRSYNAAKLTEGGIPLIDLGTLPALSVLRGDAFYRLSPDLTLSLDGQLVLGGKGSQYYGYAPQPIVINLGITYRF